MPAANLRFPSCCVRTTWIHTIAKLIAKKTKRSRFSSLATLDQKISMSRDNREVRDAPKGQVGVPADAARLGVPPQGRVFETGPAFRFVSAQEQVAGATQGLRMCHGGPGCPRGPCRAIPVVHRFCLRAAGCLAPPGQARAPAHLKKIKAYLCQGADAPTK